MDKLIAILLFFVPRFTKLLCIWDEERNKIVLRKPFNNKNLFMAKLLISIMGQSGDSEKVQLSKCSAFVFMNWAVIYERQFFVFGETKE